MKVPIVQVALDLPLAKNFDFLGPDVMPNDVGHIVIVPFGPKKMAGVIVGFRETSEISQDKLKPVILVQRALPKFSARDFAFAGIHLRIVCSSKPRLSGLVK